MKKDNTLLFLAIGFAALLLVAGLLYNLLGEDWAPQQLVTNTTAPAITHSHYEDTQPGTVESTEAAPAPAPDFTVVDGAGMQFKLSEFRGKPVVLNFWASWCGPCQSEMPDFQAAYEEYGDNIHFLMVNLTTGRETMATAKAFIQEKGYTFPVYFDTNQEAAYAYGVSGIPITFFIDADGNFVAYGQGALTADVLQMGIDMLLPSEAE